MCSGPCCAPGLKLSSSCQPIRLRWKRGVRLFTELGLFGPAFRERVSGLDAYLDSVEELLDEWGQARGIERETL